MSIPNEALQKLIREIETQEAQAQRQIATVRGQMAGKQREARMSQLTGREVAALPEGTATYEGVGRMFVAVPRDRLRDDLARRAAALDADLDRLSKRLVYLETTARNSRRHVDRMLGRDGAGSSSSVGEGKA